MSLEAKARLVATLSDNDWEPLPDDATTTVRVGDLRELLEAFNTLDAAQHAQRLAK